MKTTTDQINECSSQRQAIWQSGEENPAEVERLTKRLVDLFEEKRSDLAKFRGQTSRSDIIRRARIESEIERLISTRD